MTNFPKVGTTVDKALSGRIQALETEYNGYRFRSRTEARWAVFFGHAGVPYVYEKEAFDLGEHGNYWPDFWLPEQQAWFEIKGDGVTDREHVKASSLADLTGFPCFVAWGDVQSSIGGYSGIVEWASGVPNGHQLWTECPSCGTVGITFCGWTYLIDCDCATGTELPRSNTRSDKLTKAYRRARQERFGH